MVGWIVLRWEPTQQSELLYKAAHVRWLDHPLLHDVVSSRCNFYINNFQLTTAILLGPSSDLGAGEHTLFRHPHGSLEPPVETGKAW